MSKIPWWDYQVHKYIDIVKNERFNREFLEKEKFWRLIKMTRGINKFELMGNAVTDPEMKFLPSGTPAVTFPLAVNSYHVDQKTKEKVQDVDYFRITCYGKLAENCNQFMYKGMQVLCQGSIRQDSYEKDNKKVYVTKFVANRIDFLTKRLVEVSAEEEKSSVKAK